MRKLNIYEDYNFLKICNKILVYFKKILGNSIPTVAKLPTI
jgi:hypothetical protein